MISRARNALSQVVGMLAATLHLSQLALKTAPLQDSYEYKAGRYKRKAGREHDEPGCEFCNRVCLT
jgi:hypothetical protein